MANKFEGFQGMLKRHSTKAAVGYKEGGDWAYYGEHRERLLTIRLKDGQKAPKVETDGEGGLVVRPSRWGRKDTAPVDIFAFHGAHVWVSSKVTVNNPESRHGANLSVRTFKKKGMVDSDGTLHVRGNAPEIEARDHGTVLVGWHTKRADLYNPASLRTRTADIVRTYWHKTVEGTADIVVRRGQVAELDVQGHANITVNSVKTIVSEGPNNQITTNGYKEIIFRDENRPVIKNPSGEEISLS